MSAAVALSEPLAVEKITAPLDRFHCPVYAVTLTAASCGARQRAAREAGPRSQYGKCFDCAIGRRVVELVGAEQAASTVKRCGYRQCQAGAVDGVYCRLHGRVARGQSIAPHRRRPLSEDPELAAAAAKREERAKDEEEQSMAKQCSKDGCKREADPTKGDGALCMPHYRGVLNAKVQTGKPKKHKARAKATRSSRPAAPAATRATPKRAAHKAKHYLGGAPQMDVLRDAVEALELVTAIGWDLARQLAARVSAQA